MTTQTTHDILDELASDLNAAVDRVSDEIERLLDAATKALQEEGEDALVADLDGTSASDILEGGAPDWLEEAIEGYRQVLKDLATEA